MFKNKRWNSIIEVMVVIIILTIGIVWAYNVLSSGQKLATTSENRIKAINIAREWLEAVENIRDTNWIKFSSNYNNCWNAKNYNVLCIGASGYAFASGSYILTQSGVLWTLSWTIAPSSITGAYISYTNQFPIFLDTKGLVSSSGSNAKCTKSKTTDCKTIYTREIQISHPGPDRLKVNSIVTWVDSSKSSPYIINLETILTNWKKKF